MKNIKRFIIAAAVLLLGFNVVSMWALSAGDQSAVAAKQYLVRHPSPSQDIASLKALAQEDRKAVITSVSRTERVAIWRAYWKSEYDGGKMPKALFDLANETSSKSDRKLAEAVFKYSEYLFGKPRTLELFVALGPTNTAATPRVDRVSAVRFAIRDQLVARAFIPACECSGGSFFTWCPNGCEAQTGATCSPWSTGCGFMLDYPCDGLCADWYLAK